MSLLANSELPAGFTTIEQLAVYLGVVMSTIYPKESYLVTSTTSEKIADRAIIRASDGMDYFVARFAIPLDGEYTTGAVPIWEKALEVATVSVPARFKA